jgi:putative SOS response-associated peptidase YedK
MCAGFGFFTPIKVRARFSVKLEKWGGFEGSYNVRPSMAVPIIFRDNNENVSDRAKWGLSVPHWNQKPINLRAETVTKFPALKATFTSSRCLVPANCFYEWTDSRYGKQPYLFRLLSRRLFSFAGMYSVVKDAEGKEWKTFTIMTTTPNAVVSRFHDRMPVVLPENAEDAYLSPKTSVTLLQSLLKPYDESNMEAYPISPKINKAGYDRDDAIERIDRPALPPEQLYFQM